MTGRYAWRTRLKSGVLWPWDPALIASERRNLYAAHPEIVRELAAALERVKAGCEPADMAERVTE